MKIFDGRGPGAVAGFLLICIVSVFLICPAGFGETQGARDNGEPPNISTIKQQIRDYRKSGRWDKDIKKAVAPAMEVVERYAEPGTKPALVLDIDDTSISNYKGIERVDFAFDFAIPQLAAWFTASKAPAITAVLDLFNMAKAKHFKTFFITGREDYYRIPTKLNLKRAGYIGYDGLFMRPRKDKRSSVVPFKSGERKKLTEKGYTIVINGGDQMSDLEGGYALHTLKIPNPMYFVR